MSKRRRKRSRFVEGAVNITAGATSLALGATIVGRLPNTPVTATASRAFGIGAVALPIQGAALALRPLKKRKRRKR